MRSLSVCAALDADELAELNRYAHPFCLGAKQNLFEQDEPSLSVYNITEGAVRLYKLLPDGRRQIIGFALPGDFLGLTIETVSRLMTRLAREKALVIIPDGVRLLDLERFERLAET